MKRIKRHFQVVTDEGVLVSNTPFPESFLSKNSPTNSPPPRRPKDTKDASSLPEPKKSEKKAATAAESAATAAAEAAARRKPCYTGTAEERSRLGVEVMQPCGLCGYLFKVPCLAYCISVKAILEQRAQWGCQRLSIPDVMPSNIYSTRRLCVFCAQFFGIPRDDFSDTEAKTMKTCRYLRSNISMRVRKWVAESRQRLEAEKRAFYAKKEESDFTPMMHECTSTPAGQNRCLTSFSNAPPSSTKKFEVRGTKAASLRQKISETSTSHSQDTSAAVSSLMRGLGLENSEGHEAYYSDDRAALALQRVEPERPRGILLEKREVQHRVPPSQMSVLNDLRKGMRRNNKFWLALRQRQKEQEPSVPVPRRRSSAAFR